GRHAAAYTRALSLGDAGGRTGGDWQRLNDEPLPLSGAYLDRDETPDVRYLVEIITPEGDRLRGEPVEPLGEPDAPARNVALSNPWPSPTIANAACAVTLDSPAAVGLALYDLAGRRVCTVFQGELAAGRHELTVDTTGLPAGVYLLRLDSSGESLLRRLAVVR
ncbi:MAG: T9SS type A sorting domain-containing protein, partial [Candidatus Coatesbacteria bacterium]|nr:T9SS type A sorting domain-containing protein [Candidatus Coatesbacteria bacterium]